MKILLVDDHAILLDGIANLLEKSAHDLVEKTKTVNEALNYFAEADFDILITDFNLIDDNGLDLLRKVKRIYPNLKIIVLSMHEEASLIQEILKGLQGKVLQKESHNDLVEAIEAVSKDKAYLSSDINKILNGAIKQNNKKKLITKKEKEILALVTQDYSNEDIAEKLEVSLKTIETTLRSIFKKTKTSSVEGLLKFSYANNLI